MKLEVLNPVRDIHSSKVYEVGETIEVTEERKTELENNLADVGGFDSYFKVLEDKKKTRKKATDKVENNEE